MPRSYNPLSDFLISLADPRNLKKYRQSPAAYLEHFGVSAADRAAIGSASASDIRRQAAGRGAAAATPPRKVTPFGILEIGEIGEISDVSEISEISEIRDIREIHEISEIKEIRVIHEITEIKEIKEIHEITEIREIKEIIVEI